ncbi:MAG TPA: hypothetical protein VGP72_14755 [Planctomycetota bacterium]|jgi:hypothetical protein
MNGLLGKLGGRKFLVALATLLAVALKNAFGMDENSVLALAGIAISYVLGQGVADGWSGGATSTVAQSLNPTPPPSNIGSTLPLLFCGIGLAALLTGCGKPPAEVTQGEKIRRDAVTSYDQAMRKITDALQDGYRQECLAHLGTRQAWDIETFEKSADAQGKVNVADAKAFMARLKLAEDAGKAAIGTKIAQQNAALDEARKELITFLNLDALLQEYSQQGLDYTELVKRTVDLVKLVVTPASSATAPPK